MKILVDDEQKNWPFEQDLTLGDVIKSINERLLVDDKRVITEVKVDELEEGTDLSLTPDQVTLDQVMQISFKTETIQKNLAGEFEGALEVIDNIKEEIDEIVGHILSEEIDQGMTKLGDNVSKMIWIFNLLEQTSAIGALDMDAERSDGSTLKDFLIQFNTVLKELTGAMENGDTTLINDFLEYELEPALGDLKQILPEIQKTVSEFEFK